MEGVNEKLVHCNERCWVQSLQVEEKNGEDEEESETIRTLEKETASGQVDIG